MEVSHFLRHFESTILQSLYELDELEAERVRECGCGYCGGELDRADYWRAPRGVRIEERKHRRRFSFCCRRCRRRTTPSSVRFLGRKVYLGLVVLLISSLRQRREPIVLRRLSGLCGARAVTIRRWLIWWQESVLESSFWKSSRGLFMPPLEQERLASSLYERFRATSKNLQSGLQGFLRFLCPLTIPSQYPS